MGDECVRVGEKAMVDEERGEKERKGREVRNGLGFMTGDRRGQSNKIEMRTRNLVRQRWRMSACCACNDGCTGRIFEGAIARKGDDVLLSTVMISQGDTTFSSLSCGLNHGLALSTCKKDIFAWGSFGHGEVHA
eukprot:150589-Hanusia_phi.AAC.1